MIEIKIKNLNSMFEKIFGLIFYKKAQPVLLKTRFGIHTFGMKFPIDVLILDDKNTIVKLHKSLSPNKIFVWNIKYDTVIELPEGFISEKRIQLGEKTKLIFQ